MKFLFSASLFLSLILFTACGESYKTIASDTVIPEKGKLKDDSLLYDSIGKFYFSRIQNPGAFGLYNTVSIPKEHQDKAVWVVFEGRARSNFPHSNGTVTVMGSDDSKATLCWKASFLRFYLTETNKWSRFKDSIFLPAKLEGRPYNVINVFALLGTSPGEKFDMDSLTVTVKEQVTNI